MTAPEAESRIADTLRAMFLEDVGVASRARPSDDTFFGRLAAELGLVPPGQVAAALDEQARAPGPRLGEILQQRGQLTLAGLLGVLKVQRERRQSTLRPVGRYFLLEELGKGASGRVYRAIHQDLLKQVAVKVIREQPDLPAALLERFRREATTAARLRHPNIIGVHDVGSEGEVHYIAMDLVEGRTLRQWLAESGRPLADRFRLLEKVARAVSHAHGQGVLHRDLKPENVIVRPDGEPVLVDFGLARAATDVGLTREGAVMGTPLYMAPEQVRGDVRSIDVRTDVYSLGVMAYEIATGRTPFEGATVADVYDRVLRQDPVPPTRLRPGLAREVDAVCLKALDKDPGYRYRSAADLADDLQHLAQGDPVAATRMATAVRTWRRVRRHPRVAAGILAAAILVGAGIAYESSRRARDAEARGIHDGVAAVQAALIDLAPKVAPLLDPPRPVDVDAAVAGDSTGVGEAFRAWVRFLAEEPDNPALLDGARQRHPDNPLLPLVAAMRHVRRHARQAEWPEGLLTLNWIEQELLARPPEESPAMKDWLASARVEIASARSLRSWPLLPGLQIQWVVELADGLDLYAQGRTEEAIRRLRDAGSRKDLETAGPLFGDLRLLVAQWSGRLFRQESRRPGRDAALALATGRKAVDAWDEAVRVREADDRRLLSRGRIKFEMAALDPERIEHSLRLAIDDFDRALELRKSAEGWVCRGQAWATLGGTIGARAGSSDDVLKAMRAALDSSAAALAVDPDCVDALVIRAKINFSFDQMAFDGMASTLADLRRAREIAGSNLEVRRRIDATFSMQIDTITAAATQSRLKAADLVARGKARLALGDKAGAKVDLEEALGRFQEGHPGRGVVEKLLQLLSSEY